MFEVDFSFTIQLCIFFSGTNILPKLRGIVQDMLFRGSLEIKGGKSLLFNLNYNCSIM